MTNLYSVQNHYPTTTISMYAGFPKRGAILSRVQHFSMSYTDRDVVWAHQKCERMEMVGHDEGTWGAIALYNQVASASAKKDGYRCSRQNGHIWQSTNSNYFMIF